MTFFNRKPNGESASGEQTQQSASATVGSRIAAARKNLGYTQEEFSQLVGVTSQAVSKWENDLSCPDIMLLPKISQILGISIDELLGNVKTQPEAQQIPQPEADLSNLSLRIRVTGENRKPVNVALPMTMVKKFTKLGTGIASIVNMGTDALNSKQIDSIFNLINEGVTGQLLDVVDEAGQHIVIEIS